MRWHLVVAFAVLASGPVRAADAPSRGVLNLAAWLQRVRAHEPGTTDEAAQSIAGWSNDDMKALSINAQALFKFVRCPLCTKAIVVPPRSRRPVPFTTIDFRVLRQLADEIIQRPGEADRLLARGAILHADIAMLIDPASRAAPRRIAAADRIVVKGTDGRTVDVIDAAMHWETGRALLDLVAPDGKSPAPGEDPTVRLWYRATIAYLQTNAMHDPRHLDRALALFPGDADIQFQHGCLHETLASPRVQEMMRSFTAPRGMVFDLKSPRGELHVAEERFRRALELRPDFVEARLRLGRVLGELGQHAEAAAELRTLRGVRDELLDFYAALFLGAEEEALGRTEDARAAYERAAALQPQAQTPRLALSQLARRLGDRTAALRAIEPLLALSTDDEDERHDPWWLYHFVEGRDVDDLFDELYRPFRRAAKP